MAMRRGDKNAFWNAEAVGINGVSASVNMGREIEQVAFWLTVSAATTISVEVAHSGDLTSEGILPEDLASASWGQLYYIVEPIQIQFLSAGTACMIIPDFEPMYVRLRSSAAATITAGWEADSD